MTRHDILKAIENDAWMIEVLQIVRGLYLPDWWIGAGFVRSKAWDILHGYTKRTPLPDIDVIYFDKNDFTPDEAKKSSTIAEKKFQKRLKKLLPGINWEVTNQARMHLFHNDKVYTSSINALSYWVETATCIGARLENDKVILATPLGIGDLVNLILRPNPLNKSSLDIFKERIEKKKWVQKWPELKIVYN